MRLGYSRTRIKNEKLNPVKNSCPRSTCGPTKDGPLARETRGSLYRGTDVSRRVSKTNYRNGSRSDMENPQGLPKVS